MTSAADGFTALCFSTDALPARDRVAAFREVFGRKLARCEFEPLEHPFHVDITLCGLPGLGLASVGHSRMRVGRTRSLLADGDDALVLQIVKAGGVSAQRGREAAVEPGGAVLSSNADAFQFTGACGSHCDVLYLPHNALRPLLRDFDGALMGSVPADTPALQLLKRYIAIFDDTSLLTPDLARLAVAHVHDLAAIALGARDGEWPRPAGRAPCRDQSRHHCASRRARLVARIPCCAPRHLAHLRAQTVRGRGDLVHRVRAD
jgi:hypothetical protein